MPQPRDLSEKVQDTKRTYEQMKEWLTPPEMTEMLDRLTGPDAQAAAAASGDISLYERLVQASLSVARIKFSNDRTALIAAVMVQQGVSRPTIETGEGSE